MISLPTIPDGPDTKMAFSLMVIQPKDLKKKCCKKHKKGKRCKKCPGRR
ncbi:MAG: hypothetical protein KDC41_06340 [Saprospiraceae bacterium]|nr:hypothetical protein [Saprospiraceae bacterium]